MSRKIFLLFSVSIMLGPTGSVSADIVAHWKLDETSGTTVYDSSGNENNGTLNGSPRWTAGVIGGALHLNGSSDYVRIPFNESLRVLNRGDFTLTLWLNADEINKKHIVFQQMDLNGLGRSWLTIGNGNADNAIRTYVGGAWTVSGFVIEAGEWYHAAVVVTEGGGADSIQIYVNGEPEGNPRQDSMEDCEGDFIIGCAKSLSDTFTDGLVDDVRIYSHGLTADELQAVMEGAEGKYPLAISPTPGDGSKYEETWARLSWREGYFAASHDLYFGTDFDDVNEGAEGTFVGNTSVNFQVVGFPGFPAPEGLLPDTTYFWRVDEVNNLHPDSPWKGKVWSFWIPPKGAYNAIPADGAKFVDPNVDLTWALGLKGIMSAVYFGTDVEEVANAGGAPPVADEGIYDPGSLTLGTTYYWRVDMFDGIQWTQGEVWSFTTLPDVPITDPSLAVWWTLEEGPGCTLTVDWSGHNHHGYLVNDPKWMDGYNGGGIWFDGFDDAVVAYIDEETWPAYSVSLWAKAGNVGQNQYSSVFSNHIPNTSGFQMDVDGAIPGMYRYFGVNGGTVEIATVTTQWVHFGLTSDGTSTTLYYNGNVAATIAASDPVFNKFGIGVNRNEDNFFEGIIDEVRVYNKELTQAELRLAMRGDPLLAWAPSPANGSTPDIDAALPLSWSAGENASQHDVYFGMDTDAVDNADTSDTTGIYRGCQNAMTYTPPEGVEWGGGPYYWRIDEVNTDGTISKGKIWSFTVVDFILVDDFESYTDNDTSGEAIWQHWIDGYGVADNGAQVGYLLPPYAERTIVNSGDQSLPLSYDNTVGVTNSEAVLTLISPRDWTKHDLANLSLWFRGYPASVGSFFETPTGTYTMTGAGNGIGGTVDAFHFAYKTLTGTGSIVALINSIQNTNASAKAGVMIRETLDAGSKFTLACVTPENGVASEGRTTTDGTSYSTSEAGITAPHWVKLERDASGNFTVTHSTNGTTWESVANSVPTNVPMTSNVYIGLVLTSRDTNATCQAVFSNVTTTGTVSGQWMHHDVGITSNAVAPMYVELSNANDISAVVPHGDLDAATIDEWTEWLIPLQAFANQGVDLADVDSIAIGLGTKAGIATSGGSGTIYFDDIRLYRPESGLQL